MWVWEFILNFVEISNVTFSMSTWLGGKISSTNYAKIHFHSKQYCWWWTLLKTTPYNRKMIYNVNITIHNKWAQWSIWHASMGLIVPKRIWWYWKKITSTYLMTEPTIFIMCNTTFICFMINLLLGVYHFIIIGLGQMVVQVSSEMHVCFNGCLYFT